MIALTETDMKIRRKICMLQPIAMCSHALIISITTLELPDHSIIYIIANYRRRETEPAELPGAHVRRTSRFKKQKPTTMKLRRRRSQLQETSL
jgi:hypothetical protein